MNCILLQLISLNICYFIGIHTSAVGALGELKFSIGCCEILQQGVVCELIATYDAITSVYHDINSSAYRHQKS